MQISLKSKPDLVAALKTNHNILDRITFNGTKKTTDKMDETREKTQS